MPSRRTYVVAVGTGIVGSTAGWLSTVFDDRKRAEHVQSKFVIFDVETGPETSTTQDVLGLTSIRDGELRGLVATDHADLVDEDGSVSVPVARHERFDSCGDVRYAVSFCGTEISSDDPRTQCRGTNVSREDFNEIQFGGIHRVDFDAGEATNVEAGSTEGWEIDIDTVESTTIERHCNES